MDPRTGDTDLMTLVSNYYDNKGIVDYYLEHPELITPILNQQNKAGNTVLHYALYNFALLDRLIELGADPYIKNNKGHSPYDYITEYSEEDPEYLALKERLDREMEEPIDQSRILDRFQLFVWDFDCTITKVHSCKSKYLFGNHMDLNVVLADPDLFRRTIVSLLWAGKDVAIASYGDKDIILQTTKKLFGDANPFNKDNIVTPRDVSIALGIRWLDCNYPPTGYDKNEMLRLLQERYLNQGKLIENAEVVLFDDTEDNVDKALEDGYNAVLIPPTGCQGFNCNLIMGLNKIGLFDDLSDADFLAIWSRNPGSIDIIDCPFSGYMGHR